MVAPIHRSQTETVNLDTPLSLEQQQQLTKAFRRARTLIAATKVAAFNGWSTSVFAAISLVFALFSVKALVVGLGLALIAWNEFRGRNMLRRFDSQAARVLGWNQLGFLFLLVSYSLWSIYAALARPDPYAAYVNSSPEIRSMLEPIGDLHTIATAVVYGGVILLSFVVQGLNALYYFSRSKCLQDYLDQTPNWIVQLQRQWSQ